MSDNEDIVAKPKVKRERTPAQIEATRKMLAKRAEIDKIKREHTAAKKVEKDLNLKEKAIKTQEILKKEKEMSNFKSDEEEETPEQEVIKVKKSKPKAKKIIYQEESSSESEPEIVYVKSKKSKKKKPKKKVIYSSSSEESEEEVKPKKKQHATDKVNYNSEEQLKRDLQEERLRSALANLGFI